MPVPTLFSFRIQGLVSAEQVPGSSGSDGEPRNSESKAEALIYQQNCSWTTFIESAVAAGLAHTSGKLFRSTRSLDQLSINCIGTFEDLVFNAGLCADYIKDSVVGCHDGSAFVPGVLARSTPAFNQTYVLPQEVGLGPWEATRRTPHSFHVVVRSHLGAAVSHV